MSNEITTKIIRCIIVAILFIALFNIQGISSNREAHQQMMMLAIIVLSGLMLKNIWVTLFLWWTVFLYSFFKFETGSLYLSNIFFGSVLYLIVKTAFKKEHIDFFINGILWFTVANILFMTLQICKFDFMYDKVSYLHGIKQLFENTKPSGFMGHISLMGVLMALSIPLLATRRSKWAIAGSLGLFVPLYLSKASLCVLMGLIGFIFVLWFRMPKRIWFISIIILAIMGSLYLKFVDKPETPRIWLWKRVLRDCMLHPITGWGLDSFRNTTSYKDFKYQAQKEVFVNLDEFHRDVKVNKVTYIQYWDNPHNLYVSLFFEFGLIGLFLLIAYFRQCTIRLKNAIKYPNTIALAGFLLVFLGVSIGHFPIFLARFAVIIVPCIALFEVSTT